jgi:hypothetical protein
MPDPSSRPRPSRVCAVRARTTGLTAVALAGLVAAAVASAPPAAAAAGKLTFYGGYSYGTAAHVGSYVRSGNTAVTTLCTSQAGVRRTNHTGATSIPNVGTVGAVSTRMRTERPGSGPVSLATTKTAGVHLLGAITASAITTTARVARVNGKITRTGQTSIVGLKIAGHSAPPAHPSVGQKVAIPGVATIVLNRHVKSQAMGTYRMTVIAMTVTIPRGNALHLPAGKIVIGRGAASLHRPTFAAARGYAFGSSVNVAKLAGSGRTAAVYLPCGGSGGRTVRNNVAAAHAPNALRTGAVKSSGTSRDTAGRTVARTMNTTADPKLLGGVIKASAVKVSAQASRGSSGAVRRSNAVTVLGLTVNGQHRSGSAPANTKINLPNLGTLWIHRVIKTPTGLTVRGLDLVLSVTKNGLKRGTELIIGAAHAAVSAR